MPLLAVALDGAGHASLACSAGPRLAVARDAAGATPTKTRRATFTPLPGALSVRSGGGPVVRGTLAARRHGRSDDRGRMRGGGHQGRQSVTGDTNLVIYATDTPTPSPTPTLRPPTSTPIESIAPDEGEAEPTPFVVDRSRPTLNGRRGPGAELRADRAGQAGPGVVYPGSERRQCLVPGLLSREPAGLASGRPGRRTEAGERPRP